MDSIHWFHGYCNCCKPDVVGRSSWSEGGGDKQLINRLALPFNGEVSTASDSTPDSCVIDC